MVHHSHLLSLPPELRLAIYEAVVVTSTAVMAPVSGRDGTSLPDDSASTRYLAPWCSLMLSCRQIATELQTHMEECIASRSPMSTTWVIEMESTNDGTVLNPARRRLMCAPKHLRVLRVETALSGKEHVTETARAIHQTVAMILRHGVTLEVRQPLRKVSQPLSQIREVHLVFYRIPYHSCRRYGFPEKVVRMFRQFQLQIDAPGVGTNIETIKLVDEHHEQTWANTSSERAGTNYDYLRPDF